MSHKLFKPCKIAGGACAVEVCFKILFEFHTKSLINIFGNNRGRGKCFEQRKNGTHYPFVFLGVVVEVFFKVLVKITILNFLLLNGLINLIGKILAFAFGSDKFGFGQRFFVVKSLNYRFWFFVDNGIDKLPFPFVVFTPIQVKRKVSI